MSYVESSEEFEFLVKQYLEENLSVVISSETFNYPTPEIKIKVLLGCTVICEDSCVL
jgi:hypothetical protein